jgi:hypothetical protein
MKNLRTIVVGSIALICAVVIMSQWLVIRHIRGDDIRSACDEVQWLSLVSHVAQAPDMPDNMKLRKIRTLVAVRAEGLSFSLKVKSEAFHTDMPKEYAMTLQLASDTAVKSPYPANEMTK